jgi:hypothetical protein
MKRSDAEIFEDLSRMQEGSEDGSLHFDPSPKNYLKKLPDEEQDESRPPSTASTENIKDESQQNQQLSKEQLRNLLSAFLDQLISSKPPANAPEISSPEARLDQIAKAEE